jgi:hypothetical protein
MEGEKGYTQKSEAREEKSNNLETAPAESGVDAFEALVSRGVWNAETEAALDALFEKHEEDLYMLFLNYQESGVVDELPDHERRMYEWLEQKFGDF